MRDHERISLLHHIAKDYVVNGLGAKDFDAIPYDDNVLLRAPLTAGGSRTPLKGRETLRAEWWAPMPSLLGNIKFIDSFTNEDATAVTVEFHCEILNPACTLRVIDRFTVNDEGRIIEQENFLDPREVTNPALA